jgi:exosortase/archaeosortase family protein
MAKSLKIRNKKLFKALKFLVLFNVFSIPLYIILLTGVSFAPLQFATAQVVNPLLNAIGINSRLDGLIISVPEPSGSFAGHISWDCTGWKSMLAFAALVLATDAKRNKKLLGLAMIPLVYAFNIFRVTSVFALVSVFGAQYFPTIHAIMFSFAMVAFILLLWVAWLKYINIYNIRSKKSKKKKNK